LRKAGIAGGGITKFSKSNISIESLMVSAIKPIFDSVPDLSQGDIDAVLTSTNANYTYLANIRSELSGISPKIAHSI